MLAGLIRACRNLFPPLLFPCVCCAYKLCAYRVLARPMAGHFTNPHLFTLFYMYNLHLASTSCCPFGELFSFSVPLFCCWLCTYRVLARPIEASRTDAGSPLSPPLVATDLGTPGMSLSPHDQRKKVGKQSFNPNIKTYTDSPSCPFSQKVQTQLHHWSPLYPLYCRFLILLKW